MALITLVFVFILMSWIGPGYIFIAAVVFAVAYQVWPGLFRGLRSRFCPPWWVGGLIVVSLGCSAMWFPQPVSRVAESYWGQIALLAVVYFAFCTFWLRFTKPNTESK